MSLKKISIIIGTRPEAIKMAPVYLGLKDDRRFDVKLIVTAQHRELLDQVLDVFQINADIDLDIMQPMQGLPETSARIITQVSEALSKIKPDAVLVHGDTNTCLFSSLAAFYLKIPIGHVEAGLRTYNYNAPWPEEMNRRLTDPICQWCFAPTESARNNLRKEGIQEDRIYVTGNTVIDALFYIREGISKQPPVIPNLPQDILDHHRLILVTGHRRESFGKSMREICRAFLEIVQTHPDTVLVYPVHLNPNVQKPVREILGQEKRIFLIEPIEYLS
ncbi:MAG: non-hydrolyzing UDP-N-acetylglucosamine 2-epimerase, partial [Planctomycetota bacterium]